MIALLGKRALTWECKGQKHNIEFEITQQEAPALLEAATYLKIGLVKRVHGVKMEKDVLKDCDDL